MAASLNHFSDDDDLEEIRAFLRERIEDLAIELKGNPTSRTRKALRWGNYGSFKINISGPNQGLFYDFDGGAGGDEFAFLMHELKYSFSEALKWARNWSGIHPKKSISSTRHPFIERHQERARKAERERKQAEAERDQKADEDRRIGIARTLWAMSVDANGTLADKYLSETRKIPKPARGWPDAVRFLVANSLHMIVAATTPEGIVQAVQGVELTPEGAKAQTDRPKETCGVMRGAAMRMPGPTDKPLLIAEGPETALSLWAATGFETWATLGSSNIATQVVPLDRTIVVCLDDDKRFSGGERKATETARQWREKGRDVRLATPWPERREDKSDFNDLMQSEGEAAVRARIHFALDDGDGNGGSRKRRPVAEAWKMVDGAVENFLTAAETYDPDGDEPPVVHAVKVDVAVGKSSVARSRIAEMLAKMRVIEQATREPKRTVAFAIPTHALGDEQAAAFEALPAAKLAGLTAAVWRGRQAPDPNTPDKTMCKALPRVRDAMAVMANVQQTACRTKFDDGSEAKCPHFDECPYQLQQSQEPDVWFVAHEMLFLNKPAALGKLALIVVDEACWQDGLIGVSASPVKLALDTLLEVNRVFARRKKAEAFGMSEPGGTYVSEHDTDRLTFLRRTLMEVLQNQPDGPLARAAVQASMLTLENVAEAKGLEWRRKVPVTLHAGMPWKEWQAAVEALQSNRTIGRLEMLWKGLQALLEEGAPEASGWVETALEPCENGSTRLVRLRGRKPIRAAWNVPTMALDALLDIELIRPYWPQAEMVADVAAETPHQRVVQVEDVSFSKRRLLGVSIEEPDDAAGEDEKGDKPSAVNERAARRLRDLHAGIAAIGRAYAPSRVLVVTQKAVEGALPALGRLPPNIALAHHNAVAGRDEWRDVAALVAVGRTMPSPADVERMAEALTGAATARLGKGQWYPRIVTSREMASGKLVTVEADCHPDPMAERVRWQVAEGELVQIIGRARGVNRSEDNPVDIYLLTNVPLPLPVQHTITTDDLRPSPVELMLATGGVVFKCAAHAAKAYPKLWGSPKAAERAWENMQSRGSYPQTGIDRLLIPLWGYLPCNSMHEVKYQLSGERMRPVTGWFDPAIVPDPKPVIEKLLGAPIAWCKPVGPVGLDSDDATEVEPQPANKV